LPAREPYDRLAPSPQRGALLALAVPLAAWIAIYPARLILAHWRFGTNAYDLSVFDYALWSTLHGRAFHVPFMAHSLATQHFMPTLAVILPAYALWPSPQLLIALQALAFAGAATLLWLLARRRLPPVLLAAVVVAFLFGRRSHSAVSSVFYIESFEPLLVFAVLYAQQRRRWVLFGAMAFLALGCKEDMPLYLGTWGVLQYAIGRRRLGAWTSVLSAAWLVTAVFIVLPSVRALEGLPRVNAFWESRVGDGAAPVSGGDVAARVWSVRTATRLAALCASTGFLAVLSPSSLAVALPGALLNLSARPDSVQAGLTGHYLWPVLPWLFWAAVQGGMRLSAWSPRAANVIAVLIVAATVADSPLWLSLSRGFAVSAPVAAAMRDALELVPAEAPVLAQPNLIPHLPHRQTIYAFGQNQPAVEPAWVILTTNGDLWPLDTGRVMELIACYSASPMFVRVTRPDAAVSIFRRNGADPPTSPSLSSLASVPAPCRGSSVRW
jgi:uncharacterized membrane protein